MVSERLVAAVRPDETVARLGGDEFAILLERTSNPVDEATAIAERILSSMGTLFDLGGTSVAVGASTGIATIEAGVAAPELLRTADVAMYDAKAAGRGAGGGSTNRRSTPARTSACGSRATS